MAIKKSNRIGLKGARKQLVGKPSADHAKKKKAQKKGSRKKIA
jgi:hypothetical protein